MPKPSMGDPEEPKIQLFTLGYSGLPVDGYFDIIQAAGVEALIDVRKVPMSRKPGYSKKRLAEGCAARGLQYEHIVALGTPDEIRFGFPEKDRSTGSEFDRRVLEYLETQPDALQALAGRARREVCCLTCLEADPAHCHRRLVADRVQEIIGKDKCEVVHLRG